MNLMKALLAFKTVTQPTQIQPALGSVDKVFYSRAAVSRQPGYTQGQSLHVTRDMLSGPIWGATNPNAFITISGIPPHTPIIGQVATTLGSNAPVGGNC